MNKTSVSVFVFKVTIAVAFGVYGLLGPFVAMGILAKWCSDPIPMVNIASFVVCAFMGYIVADIMLRVNLKGFSHWFLGMFLGSFAGGIYVVVFRLAAYFICSGTLNHRDTISWSVKDGMMSGMFCGILLCLFLVPVMMSAAKRLKYDEIR